MKIEIINQDYKKLDELTVSCFNYLTGEGTLEDVRKNMIDKGYHYLYRQDDKVLEDYCKLKIEDYQDYYIETDKEEIRKVEPVYYGHKRDREGKLYETFKFEVTNQQEFDKAVKYAESINLGFYFSEMKDEVTEVLEFRRRETSPILYRGYLNSQFDNSLQATVIGKTYDEVEQRLKILNKTDESYFDGEIEEMLECELKDYANWDIKENGSLVIAGSLSDEYKKLCEETKEDVDLER